MAGGFTIIDRRKNPKAKSLSNRQRFVQRAQKAIRESAKKALSNKSINDEGDTKVSIPLDGVEEHRFRHNSDAGEYHHILPGNTEYIVGDIISKPPKKNGRGSGGDGSDGSGGGEDDFQFALTYDEYLNVIFDDLELPDLVKKTEKNAVAFVSRRSGYTNAGMPSNLSVERTVVAGMSRRIALKSPKLRRIKELEAEASELLAAMAKIDPAERPEHRAASVSAMEKRLEEIEAEIKSLRTKANAVGFLDNVDMRYNNFTKVPRPITQAVMFCIMDVSFSMGEREKIIAKKFFVLLHLFLKRRYENIDVVFVRHHDQAMECDEETFFTSREGGGTVVSTAYEKVKEIIAARYNSEDWNIYMAQASDGDNSHSDNTKVEKILVNDLLPMSQHFTYIEIADESRSQIHHMFGVPTENSSAMWRTIRPLMDLFDNMTAGKITDERYVVRVFRKLFSKHKEAA